MSTTVLLAIALALAGQAKGDPDQFPLALHRSMEIDDLDREVQRLHDSVLLKSGQLAGSQRLAARGLLSRTDLERDTAALLFEKAHEAETIAYRALKTYERDVMGRAAAQDEVKAYSLLLDWLKKQEEMARVDLDFRDYSLKQTRSLYQRKAVSRQELDDAELNFNTAQASVVLSQSRQGQVAMELAARRGEKSYDPAEYDRLKHEYQKMRIRYYEIIAEGARSRLAIATERSRRGLIPVNELEIFQKAADDAVANLAAERKKPAPGGDPAAAPTPRPR